MIRRLAQVHGDTLRLLEPCELPEGTFVEVQIQLSPEEALKTESMERLEEVWDNPEDAIYDNWRELYGVQRG